MSVKKNLSISAVVVNHNGGDNVVNCVDALYSQNTPLSKIIIVDNASTDRSPESLETRFPGITIIRLNQNEGLSKARNIGMAHVKTDLILLLDDDVYVSASGVGLLIDAYLETNGAIICPRIHLHPDRHIIQCDGASPHFIGNIKLRHAYQEEDRLNSELTTVGASIGACMLLHRDVVTEIGGFNEEYFFYFEDLEFSLRMRAFGHQILCHPKAKVFHDKGEGTPGLSFRKIDEYPRRRAFFTIRHRWLTILLVFQVRTILFLLPLFLVYELGTIIMVIKNRWGREWWQAIVSLFQITDLIIRDRDFIQSNRRLGDLSILNGGELQFAPGLIVSKRMIVITKFISALFNIYWKLASPFLKP